MGVITFAPRKSIYHPGTDLHDKVLEAGGIAIDQDAYTVNLDRIYNVKGLKNMHFKIENTGGVNGLTFKIENTEKEFTDDGSSLVDADFDQDILGDTNVAFGAKSRNDIIDISPETTAIRIRVKREISGNDTTLAGVVSAD